MEQVYSQPRYRRSYQRFRLDGSVTLVVNENKQGPSILKDLSPRGAGVITYHPLKENEKLAIIIDIPSLFNTTLHKESKVAWCKKIQSDLWQGGLDFGEDKKIDFVLDCAKDH
jgi:hypothetical protein